jgi:hypothetical protein
MNEYTRSLSHLPHLRGSRTNGIRSVSSLCPSVSVKKNRSAVTAALRLGVEMPLEDRCS